MIFIDNEYLLNINDEVFKVYHQNEKLAMNRFRSGCTVYMKTSNENYRKYWQNMIDLIDRGEYEITELNDFLGFRKVV